MVRERSRPSGYSPGHTTSVPNRGLFDQLHGVSPHLGQFPGNFVLELGPYFILSEVRSTKLMPHACRNQNREKSRRGISGGVKILACLISLGICQDILKNLATTLSSL